MTPDKNESSQQAANGVVTVNDGNNPTQQQRDEIIGQEPDTARLRSEKESVEENKQNTNYKA